jgi:hypothetical protein
MHEVKMLREENRKNMVGIYSKHADPVPFSVSQQGPSLTLVRMESKLERRFQQGKFEFSR